MTKGSTILAASQPSHPLPFPCSSWLCGFVCQSRPPGPTPTGWCHPSPDLHPSPPLGVLARGIPENPNFLTRSLEDTKIENWEK